MGAAPQNGPAPSTEIVAARPIAQPSPPLAAPPTPPPSPSAPPPDPRTLPDLSRRQAALDLGLVVTLGLVVPHGFELAARLSAAGSEAESALPDFNWLIVTHQWFGALLAVSLAAYLVYRHHVPAAAFGLQPQRLGRQLLHGAATLGALYGVLAAVMIVVWMFALLVPGLEHEFDQRKEFLGLLPIDNLPATLLLMLAVAIHEELLFRGLLLPYLRRVGLSWTVAVLASTGVFAVLHIDQGAVGIAQVFCVGLVLALGFLWSRSLTAVILAHFAFNVVQIQVVVRYLMPAIERLSEGS